MESSPDLQDKIIKQARAHFFAQLSRIASDYGYKLTIDDALSCWTGRGFISTTVERGSVVVLEFAFDISPVQNNIYISFYDGNMMPEQGRGDEHLKGRFRTMRVSNLLDSDPSVQINRPADQLNYSHQLHYTYNWIRQYMDHYQRHPPLDQSIQILTTNNNSNSDDTTSPIPIDRRSDDSGPQGLSPELKKSLNKAIALTAESQSLLSSLKVNYYGLIQENQQLKLKLKEQSTILIEENHNLKRELEQQRRKKRSFLSDDTYQKRIAPIQTSDNQNNDVSPTPPVKLIIWDSDDDVDTEPDEEVHVSANKVTKVRRIQT